MAARPGNTGDRPVTWRSDAAPRGRGRATGRAGPGRLRLPGPARTRPGARPGPHEPRPDGRDAPARGGGPRGRTHARAAAELGAPVAHLAPPGAGRARL